MIIEARHISQIARLLSHFPFKTLSRFLANYDANSFSTPKVKHKLFIAIQNSEYIASLDLRTSYTVAEVS